MFRVWGGGLKTLAVQSVGLHMEASKIRAPHAKECRTYIQVYITPPPHPPPLPPNFWKLDLVPGAVGGVFLLRPMLDGATLGFQCGYLPLKVQGSK